MKIVKRVCKSQKYRGLQVATAVFEDGSQLLLTPKPEGGERIEAKMRTHKAWQKDRAWPIVNQTI